MSYATLYAEIRVYTDVSEPDAPMPIVYAERCAFPTDTPRVYVLLELEAAARRVLSAHDHHNS